MPFRDDREDLAALLHRAIETRARILYISNPNNPMGTWWDAAALNDLIARLPPDLVLLLDEAYCDTAPAGTVPAIDVSNPQVLRLRTFSKAYGLAGARIGYCLGEAGMISAFEKVRNHYGINRVGQIGALAAVEDQAYLAQRRGPDRPRPRADRCDREPQRPGSPAVRGQLRSDRLRGGWAIRQARTRQPARA